MGKNRPLSVIPYYGGKAKMASFISERLDYNTSVFVTLFGGGCRELLNKPPHPVEFYNEYDSGLCALMGLLSNPVTAQELIDKLYYDTVPTKEQFLAAKDLYWCCKEDVEQVYRNELKTFIQKNLKFIPTKKIDQFLEEMYRLISIKDDRLAYYQEDIKNYLIHHDIVYGSLAVEITDDILDLIDRTDPNNIIVRLAEYLADYGICSNEKALQHSKKIINKINVSLHENYHCQMDEFMDSASEEMKQNLQFYFGNWYQLKRQKENGALPRYRDMTTENISDLDLAVATYLVYTLSFSAIGTFYGSGKFKTDEAYKRHILNLYDCADRLKNVKVLQLDAMSFFKQHLYKDTGLEGKSILYDWLNNPDVMMFADPSYISPSTESQVLHYTDASKNINIQIDLEQIDVEHGEWVSDAIEEAWAGRKMPKNLGSSYARSFGYKEQEQFLRSIQNAKCKMLVCNYDLQLYDRYLTQENGWSKETYLTKTTVSNSSTKSKERLEVIWRNY